jgi:hypothetical protein
MPAFSLAPGLVPLARPPRLVRMVVGLEPERGTGNGEPGTRNILRVTPRMKVPIGNIVQGRDRSPGRFEQQPDVVVDVAFLAMHLR